MAKTLDDFLGKWAKENESKEVTERLQKTPYDPRLYGYIINETQKLTGKNPTIGPKGVPIELAPDKYVMFGEAVNVDKRKSAIEFSKANIEKILGETNEDKLFNIAYRFDAGNNPQDKDLAEKIKKYQVIMAPLELLKRGEEEAKTAVTFMYQNPDTMKYLKESLKEGNEKQVAEGKTGDKRIMDGDELNIWANAFMYAAPSNPNIMIGAYQFKAKELEAGIKAAGKSKLINYTKSAITANPSQEDKAYEMIYQVLSAKE